jgi:glutamate dehydrogenase
LTQRGRIEFALARSQRDAGGGKVNTDFIDNSGGVDCSDHEVNIKILLEHAVAEGRLDREARNRLLEEMTDEVAALVLRDNYLQTQAISIEEARGPALMHHQARTLRRLEQVARLDRDLEFLPDEEGMRERQKEGVGLTRPEIAVLLAYSKLALYEDILASDLPDDPLLVEDLVRYFPTPLQERFRRELETHPLRREIIATTTNNSMVNRVGPTFVVRMEAETGRPPRDIARAYTVARDAFNLRDLWAYIEKLDDRGVADLQLEMIQEAAQLVERATLWLLRNGQWPLNITAAVGELGAGARDLEQGLEEILTPDLREGMLQRIHSLEDRGAPPVLARHVGALPHLTSVCDLVRIADGRHEVWRVGRIYYAVGDRFGLNALRRQTVSLPVESRWEKEAAAALVEDLFAQQRDLTSRVLQDEGPEDGATDAWIESRPGPYERVHELLEEVLESATVDLSMLTVATHQLRRLVVGG